MVYAAGSHFISQYRRAISLLSYSTMIRPYQRVSVSFV